MLDGELSVVFSVGHSSHPLQVLIELVRKFQVEVLVDVRSQPYSRFAPQFNARPLKNAILLACMRYVFLGKELGGRPEGKEFYDDEGYVLYERLSQSPLFLEGISRLQSGLSRFRVALLCSEEDPTGCHRRLLIGQSLRERGIEIRHIRGDGRLQTEEDLQRTGGQAFLFREPESPRRSVTPLHKDSRRPKAATT